MIRTRIRRAAQLVEDLKNLNVRFEVKETRIRYYGTPLTPHLTIDIKGGDTDSSNVFLEAFADEFKTDIKKFHQLLEIEGLTEEEREEYEELYRIIFEE